MNDWSFAWGADRRSYRLWSIWQTVLECNSRPGTIFMDLVGDQALLGKPVLSDEKKS